MELPQNVCIMNLKPVEDRWYMKVSNPRMTRMRVLKETWIQMFSRKNALKTSWNEIEMYTEKKRGSYEER